MFPQIVIRMMKSKPLKLQNINRFFSVSHTIYQGNAKDDLNQPLKFLGSSAAMKPVRETNSSGRYTGGVDYQNLVIAFSLGVFLIYFCILREESDIDGKFDKTLYDHIYGLEEKQLEIAINQNLQLGRDTTALKARLTEIRTKRQ